MTQSEVFLCTQLSKEGETLQVSACDGVEPFALAPHDVIKDATPCGVVGAPSTFDDPRFIQNPQYVEACFFAAYQHCLAGSMRYQTLSNGALVERDFSIDTNCGITYQRGAITASCTTLEMHADGLQFWQCGTEGDLFVPSAPQ